MTDISNAQLMERLKAATENVSAKLGGLSDADVLAPTELEGWTRGHVLAHIAHVSNAVARQVEYAVRGELIEFYDGGQGGRTQAIEMNAGHTAQEHKEYISAGFTRVLTALDGLDDEQWNLPISYRNGVVRDGALAYWREMVIHLADLQLGRGPETWSKEFALYVIEFLTSRVPADIQLKLLPLGLPPMTVGAGENTVSIQGMITDIAAWLAGRTPSMGSLRAEAAADSVQLPTLLPWPSAFNAK
ncbi:maleylpyruvate isomerase family mycothiol-dependent enzyme [Arthrobacter antibioticus]|uniref:maleylpyruvate isomerase family mycothiol-dependent enzyme n=1 Tax=Arthrobacter sp. H35-MC1 TaxID=3046203 RepID=UPI0024BA1DF8|nr:maleylpyruvate isomerase family mycothiol-dependent enzyme [Arthrobacter sp. H35-MC1]MDJ0317672.1 maleylpyruvate isomerase family mycothiol-dependent enzyme [Arthrobacter sp. H35-MC1]